MGAEGAAGGQGLGGMFSPAGEEGALEGLPPPLPEAGGLDLGGGAQSLDQLFEGSFYGIEERRIQRVARRHDPTMEPISEDWAVMSPGFAPDDRAFDPPELGQSLPSDPDQLLRAYVNLSKGGRYEGQPGDHPDYVGAGYRCFDMGEKADFLVRQDGEGQGLLDFSDVVMFQKEVGVYCRPAFSGAKCEGPASYYTFPWVQWFPGDPLEGKPEESVMTKMIFVERLGAGRGPGDGAVRLNLDRCFVLDGENTMVLSMGPSEEAELSRHGKRGTAQTGCRMRDVRAYDEGAAPTSPTTMRVNFSKLRPKPAAEEDEPEGGGGGGGGSARPGVRPADPPGWRLCGAVGSDASRLGRVRPAPPRGLGAEEGRGQHLHHGLGDRPQRAVALLPDWALQLSRNGLEVAALRAGGAGPEGGDS